VAAKEFAARGIRGNAIAPGSIDTPLFEDVVHGTPHSREDYEKRTPMKRTAKAEEVAASATWLCSDAAAYVTGIVLPVDGGNNPMSTSEKTIFITGSSSGLGRAAARLFASKGWKVIATMRTPEKETELASIPGVKLMALDTTDADQIRRGAQDVIGHGGVDVVFNNAGYGMAGPLEGFTDEQIVRMIDTNLMGAIRVTKAFVPYFRQKRAGLFKHYVHRRINSGAVQLHLPCDQMGAGKLEREHGS
jgi:NAD(P)-dependent dehydrogenase (short-subunit alcohol dehydrogenase family)